MGIYLQTKTWKEYLTEFLMLFFAVTLGFFAENLREMQIDKVKEIGYLKNIHNDLTLTFYDIDSVIRINTSRLNLRDSLFTKFNNNSLTNEEIHYYIRILGLRGTFESTHSGFEQVKSVGGLRMIHNEKIVMGIQKYEKALESIEKLEETREKTIEAARFKSAAILNAMTVYQMSINQNLRALNSLNYKKPAKSGPIMQRDEYELNELLNLISISINTNYYLNSRLLKLKEIGKQLDDAILKEYPEVL
jgi:hypothetical protein